MTTTLYKKFFWLLSLFLLAASTIFTPLHAEEDFLDPEKAFIFSAQMQTENRLHIHFKVAPKYYMYRERFEFHIKDDNENASQAASLLGTPEYPVAGLVKYDPTFDQEMEVYYDKVDIFLPIKASDTPFNLEIIGQGCADAGLCYPPTSYDISLSPTATGYEITAGKGAVLGGPAAGGSNIDSQNDVSLFDAGDTDIASWLNNAGLLKIVLICFALGVLLSFTPCVLPMLPILLAIVVGDKKSTDAPASRIRGLKLTLMYVLGTSIVYTILGIVAASIGAVLAAWIQNPWVLGLFSIALVILALGMFGAFTIQMPASMQSSLNQKVSRMPGGRMGNAFFMGMVSALICGPCVAAPLAGVLLFISQTGDVFTGGLALFVLAWGQGVSLLILGTSSGALLPKSGPWMEGVKYFCGLLLLATALWMIMPVTPVWFHMLAWAFLAFCLALLLGTFTPYTSEQGILKLLLKASGLLAAVWAALLMLGLAGGSQSLLTPLKGITGSNYTVTASGNNTRAAPAQAHEETPFIQVKSLAELNKTVAGAGKPVMLDFYADWCISCKEMERFTFSDPAVKQKMAQMLLLQVDVTKNNEADRELLKRFKLFGPPGIIFFNAQGQEPEKIRVVGFQNAGKFSSSLDRVLVK